MKYAICCISWEPDCSISVTGRRESQGKPLILCEETHRSQGAAGDLLFTSLTYLIREAEVSKDLQPFPETSNIYFRKGQVLSACHLQNTNMQNNREKSLLFYLLGRENE